MPRVDKTMLVAVLAGAAIAAVSASCANSCSGHGSCGSHDRCTCYAMWEGTDCSKRICPSGPSFTSGGSTYEVCSGRGTCDSGSGTCTCSEGYTGYNCGRTSCPNDCSGHGKCMSTGVDGGMTQACVCDGYYTGIDCSFRQCPRGDDPLTTEIECQGVSSGAQSHEVQEITLTADKQLSGDMTLTYTDAYGQSWTTMPIQVGGDLEFDLRMTKGINGCSLKYMSATLTPEKFRSTADTTTTIADHDFAATEFAVPGVLAAAMNNVECSTLTAEAMESLLKLNGVVKNVKVTKSGDASTDTARFHVSIGDINFQNENDGMEVGIFSLVSGGGAGTSVLHSLGDRSQDIKDALEALPYNVIPSVDVSRVKVDGGSDYADSTVVYGNMVQQKYRITFSDAANAGDQAELQCNAVGCDADGCAPRYKGVTHKRYISTKYGSDPMSTEGGVTDYRTAIVATGQGSWWLRSHSLNVNTRSPFTSGTYHVHWDLGNGKVSSASFPYNANAATIQSALRTIEGWGGVSVSCNGEVAFAGRKYTSDEGLECKVTYAKGFDDGGKLPTITYTNIHQGMDAAIDGAGNPTHFTDLTLGDTVVSPPSGDGVTVDCVNEFCLISNIGGGVVTTNKDYTTASLFSGVLGVRTGAVKASCSSQSFNQCFGAKQDNFIGYVYIRHGTPSATFPMEGNYEIIRVGSSSHLDTRNNVDLLIHVPGVADVSYTSGNFPAGGRLYKATPLMPMWPSFSNTIALHDTSYRIVFAPHTSEGLRLGPADNTVDTWETQDLINLHYGPNSENSNDGATPTPAPTKPFTASTTCEGTNGILDMLNGFTGGGPFPSLASADGTSICDCKRTTMEVDPFEIEVTITCPGWLGYMLSSDIVQDSAETTDYLETFVLYDDSRLAYNDGGRTTPQPLNVFTGHRRLSPERSLEQLVAVGDTITVTASASNDNKQFKVKSFAYDNMWGDGNKGTAIWSAKSGYLGGDGATGFGDVVSLDSKIDYVSYGDFVPFVKVDPAPADDYFLTEMYAEGTNGTSFTRTLQDISSFRSEIATLRVYDKPDNEAIAAINGVTSAFDNNAFDASQLTGSFQLIYDGEESPVIPVTASANQMMQYLSEMANMVHVPVVSKCCKANGDDLDDDFEATVANQASVAWTFTFDPRLGDAKKLTFKFVDATTDERKTSNIIGSGGDTTSDRLVNQVSTYAVPLTGAKSAPYANNKIVMTYSSGSAFYDSIDADYTAISDLDSGSELAPDLQVSDNKFHDELAMDVVPGTKLKVSSSEVHHMYIYQTITEGAADAITDPKLGCTANAKENPHVVLEYAGAFTSAVSLCQAANQWNTDSAMEALIEADISALKGISISIDDTSMSSDFNDHFAWGEDHSGNVRGRFSFTLPMGADGDSFKVHFQSGLSKASGINWYHDDAKSSLLKIFTYRERNNNGREFTVTKAYENKVSDLISVSLVGAYIGDTGNGADGGSLAGIIHSPAEDGIVPGSSPAVSLKWSDFHDTLGCGSVVHGSMNPGTYYNVRTKSGVGTTPAGAGAILMVVVNGDGKISQVEVTSGGNGKYKSGDTIRFADTRIHASMAYITSARDEGSAAGDHATECMFKVGDMSNTKSQSTPLKSIASGIIYDATLAGSNTLCITVTDGAGCAANTKYQNVPVDHDTVAGQDIVKGFRMAVECSGSATIEKLTVTNGGTGSTEHTTGSTAVTNEILAIGDATSKVSVAVNCINDYYYQFGFYDTTTPRWNRDLAQNNYDMGATPKDEQVALYGMKNHMQYQFKHGSAKQAAKSFYGLGRDTFSDLNSGLDSNMAGYSIRDSTNEEYPQMTASVLAGENGQRPTGEFMEHAEKYAYIGKGFDKLTISPLPDLMTDQKITIQYTGPSAGCTVTEVDRGTHESAECSGRGNCDHSTGTCVCDAGYTLEACSEQTVLV